MDIHTYQGSTDCFLFRISPSVKYLVPLNGEDIEDKSYTNNGPDLTYGHGFIASPATEKLKIRDIEIWGLGTAENLREQ
jgi:hypothetical protein